MAPNEEEAAAENSCRLKLDRAASWVRAGLATAFFTSLERCACVNISTMDSDADDETSDHRPLILTKHPSTLASSNKLPTPAVPPHL